MAREAGRPPGERGTTLPPRQGPNQEAGRGTQSSRQPNFSPSLGEEQSSAGRRVRDEVRRLVRDNGGSPADLG